MLQNIRDKSQGWLAWLVVIVLCATFVLWGIHAYVSSSMSGNNNNNVAAYVNKKPISQSQVEATYARLRQQQQYQLGANFAPDQNTEAQLKQQALSQLIIANVLTQAAYKTGYRVTTNQVDEALLRIPAFQVNGQFSIDRFHDVLNSVLYTQDQFLMDMRNSMLVNQVQDGYVNSSFALPSEIADAIRLVNQKRDISYFIIPAQRFNQDIKVSSADAEQYYQAHQNEFQSPEQVSIQYLELSLPALEKKLNFDQTKLQQYYENNLDNYMHPESWHVAHILIKLPAKDAEKKAAMIEKQIAAGKDFGQLAKQYSDDSLSAKQNGELPWFSAGQLDPAFEKAAASLRVNEVSTPIKTSQGLEIIKLLSVRKATVAPFAEVKEQVRAALTQQQAQQSFADESSKLASLTYSNPSSLDIAAKTLNLPIQTTGLFGHQGGKDGVTANPLVVAAAFNPDVLTQGNNSDVIPIDQNTVVVLRVSDHKPAAVQPFATVQSAIQTKLTALQAKQKAQTVGEQLVKKLQGGQSSIIQLAQQQKLSWQVDNNAGRYDTRIDAPILAEAFHIARPQSKNPSFAGLALPSGDYAVIAVNAVHDGVLSSDGVQQRVFQEQIEDNFGRIVYQLHVKELMDRAKIKVEKSDAASSDNTDSNE